MTGYAQTIHCFNCNAVSTLSRPKKVLESSRGSSSSQSRPNKRALLCGVSYKKRKYRLKGTINDVKHMKDLLINQFGYPLECIRVLSEEEEPGSHFAPTKKNIQESLKWLVEGSESGDSLVFYFSGHGLRQPDFNNDEIDGFDETICPVDFMKEGMILDNEINSTIVWPLKQGVTLHAIVDACHSGTILDLVHVYNPKTMVWVDNSPPSKAKKSTDGGLAICLSACGDDQMAADTSAFLDKGMIGAMTFIFIQTIKKHSEITYGTLMEEMHKEIQEANKDKCPSSRILRKFFRHRTIEDPLLSTSEIFDVYLKKFTL